MSRLLLSCLLAVYLSIPSAFATEKDVEHYKHELISLNQNIGTYYFIEDHLAKGLQDQNHTQIGSVQDFLINERGQVEQLIGELNDMNLGQTTLTLAYNDLEHSKNSYTLAMNAENMEEELAIFLSNIETAAGYDAADLISTRRLKGRQITLPTGEPIGIVENVITDKENYQVVGVLVKSLETRPEHERIALPYPNGLKIKNTGFSNNLQLAEEYVEIVQEFCAAGIPN